MTDEYVKVQLSCHPSQIISQHNLYVQVPAADRSKARVYDRSPAENVGSNPAVGMDVCLLWLLCVVR